MKSPFPGMDPYLEAHWGDVHTSFVTYARDQLQTQMPRELRVRVEEHVTLQVSAADGNGAANQRGRFPDVRIVEHSGGGAEHPPRPAVALAEPRVIPLQWEETRTQRSIRILDTQSGHRVVTAIEVLSPANKVGADERNQYLGRQQDLLDAGVSLVEVDLLRGGRYVLAVPANALGPPDREPYRACIIRGYHPGQAEMYHFSLRERLPAIPIPLRENDPDAYLDLQEVINKCYENGGYDVDINYRRDADPPLRGDDAAWADQLLREKGLR